MKMRLLLILIFVSFSLSNLYAVTISQTDTVNDVIIKNQQIISAEEVVGNIKTLTLASSDSKSKSYKVQIFEKSGSLIAEYDLEVLSKQNKNQDAIVSAQIKTLSDNVVHNGNNFIDFHFKSTKKDALFQLNKVVEYLLKYKYL